MRNIYYISGHYTELILYHGLSSFFRKFFPEVEQHLVLAEHPMFSRVDYEEFLEGFDSVHRLPFCECAYTSHWRSELRPFAIYGRLARARAFLREASKFKFEEGSLCFVSPTSETVLGVRLLIRKIRTDARHSLLCRIGTWHHISDKCETNDWISWLLHNVYVLVGAYPVSVQINEWMVGERRFYREKAEKEPASSQSQYVLFLGQGTGFTSLFPEMSREQFITTTNQVLRALTDLYRNQDVALLFKPHPRQGEIPYDLAGFDVCDKSIIAEAMFLRDRKAIRAVYGITSTSVRTASLLGIDAYVFYELYDFPIERRLQRYLLDFSDVVSIRSLDELRLPQPKPNRSPSANDQDLERLAQLFQEMMQGEANV